MTLTEIVELAAKQVGSDPKLFWGFADALICSVIGQLEQGVDVKIRGLGTFTWVNVPAKELPGGHFSAAGKKLKFKPSKRLQRRRTVMSDSEEGMTKYAVVLDDEKTKTASNKRPGHCPECDKDLDKGGACPTHGTEPFEPRK